MCRLVILLALLLSACTASHEPLAGDEALQADSRLIGQWRFTVANDDPHPALLTISELAGGRMLVEYVPENAPGNTPERLELISTRLGGESYGSAAPLGEPGAPGQPRYAIFRYEHETSLRVRLRIAAIPLLEEAARLRQIGGRNHPDDRHGVDIFEITSPRTELQDFVAEHGPRIFRLEGPLLERLPAE
jgi:hypothetical protein